LAGDFSLWGQKPANPFADYGESWQSVGMNRKSKPAGMDNSDLQLEVQLLRDEVRVLRDVIDEFRELIEYTVQNGLPIKPDFPFGIVKHMARDPNDPKWSDKLVVLRSGCDQVEPNETSDPCHVNDTEEKGSVVADPKPRDFLF
jgi:hypothetical protein